MQAIIKSSLATLIASASLFSISAFADTKITSNGFYTNLHGDRSNEVKYHRVR